MKKFTLLVAFSCLISLFNLNYSFANSDNREKGDAKKVNIVATTFPIYDYLREIIGSTQSNFNLTLLINNGIDLHNFQPSTKDIATISQADVFIYNGGDSDLWVKEVLAQAINKNMETVDLMMFLGDRVKEEIIVEGMEEHDHSGHNHGEHAGHDCDHDHGDHAAHDHGDAVVYDEHVWLSLKNTILICEMLSEKLQNLDKVNAAQYAENAKNYIAKLKNLDAKYTEIFDKTPQKTLLFADRFPFRYLLDDYNISYYAAFPGCSAETEASFDTVIFLAKKINELGLDKVFIIDNSINNIASAIIKNSERKDAEIISLNSLQTITPQELAKGVSYVSIMEENLNLLHKALGNDD